MYQSTQAISPTIPMGLHFPVPASGEKTKAPRHLALVLQGHRLWALSTDLPYAQVIGAAAGRLLELIDFCATRGLPRVTIHLFADDFLLLPPGEHPEMVVTLLRYVSAGAQNMNRNNVSLRIEGSLHGLEPLTKALLQDVTKRTGLNTGLQLTVIVDNPRHGARSLAPSEKESNQAPEVASSHPDLTEADAEPDFVVRTGGSLPAHRAMVWDTFKTALCFTHVPWPRFDARGLREALDWFGNHHRPVGVQLNS